MCLNAVIGVVEGCLPQADVGTVLILHGMEDDWLGNNGSEGRGRAGD